MVLSDDRHPIAIDLERWSCAIAGRAVRLVRRNRAREREMRPSCGVDKWLRTPLHRPEILQLRTPQRGPLHPVREDHVAGGVEPSETRLVNRGFGGECPRKI